MLARTRRAVFPDLTPDNHVPHALHAGDRDRFQLI
jgi:hypothetical protein